MSITHFCLVTGLEFDSVYQVFQPRRQHPSSTSSVSLTQVISLLLIIKVLSNPTGTFCHSDTATDTTVTVTKPKHRLTTETTVASHGKEQAMATLATQPTSHGITSRPLPMATTGLPMVTLDQNLL